MSFNFDFSGLNGIEGLDAPVSVLELEGGLTAPQPVLSATAAFPLTSGNYVKVDQALVDALLERGIPVAEGLSSDFVGVTGVFEGGSVPGLTAPMSDSFGYDFFVNNGGNADLDSFIPLVIDVASAAMEYLGQFIVGADGATLEVGINLTQQGATTLASAGAGDLFIGGENADGVTEILTGTQIELVTGTDPNGDDVDIIININTDFLTQSIAFFGTESDRVVPSGSIDYVSILTHEILHGLGFFSFRDNSGQDVAFDLNGDGNAQVIESTYGLNVSFEDTGDAFLSATYDSANMRDVYGDAVQLETTFNSGGSDVSHFARFNPDGTVADTATALMNPAINGSNAAEIGLLELAVLQDLFYTVNVPAGTPIFDSLDAFADSVPTIDTPSQLLITSAGLGFNIDLDFESPFGSLPGSVGVEITTTDGVTVSERAIVPADTDSFFFALGEDALRAIVESDVSTVTLRLFNPAQLQLEGGVSEVSVTIPFIAELDNGTAGNDTLTSMTAAPSLFFGGSGNDTMTGNDGIDVFYGDEGNDFLRGGAGNDNLNGGDGNDFVSGASGNDNLSGGAGNDSIFGGQGTDIVEGGEGDDVIRAGSGDDIAAGGEGDDFLFGENGNDFLNGEGGDDYLGGGEGDDIILGGDGDDSVFAGQGDDSVEAGEGNDEVSGGSGNDFIDGSVGDDTLRGDGGDDTIFGGEGDDFISGNSGDDALYGEAGEDTVYGGSGDDLLSGGDGNDELYGQANEDTIFGGEGDDILNGGNADDELNGGNDNDTLLGELGDDVLNGDAGDDYLGGAAGDDVLNGGDGNDELYAGQGDDVLDGGAGDDELFGGSGDDSLTGGDGDDTLDGQGGDDIIFGGAGEDILTGGAGNDVFEFGTMSGVDAITDFTDGEDMLNLTGFSDTEIQTALDNAFEYQGDVFMVLGSGNVVILQNFDIDDLDADDFMNFEGVDDDADMMMIA